MLPKEFPKQFPHYFTMQQLKILSQKQPFKIYLFFVKCNLLASSSQKNAKEI